uniref:Cadherin domain-containing protein n=1 Tax=Callorhinchus milii TaxID=7868 RepID=A0A4W3JTI7_CALMI
MRDSVSPCTLRKQMLSSIFLLCVSNLVSGQIRYSVPEELEPGAFVGNIAKDLGFNVEDLSDRGLRIISDTQTQYLDVNLQSGILFVSKRIDREQLCGENPTCFLALEVVIEKPMEQYHVEVEILDINDNSPSFSSREIRLEIVESVLPGARFLLKSAKDPDVGLNSIRTYQLTPNEYFILDVQTRGEWKLAELVLEKPLDREKQSSHQLLLTAIDGGSPEKSGTTLIIITVLDINDNAPIFHQSLYTVSLVENIPVGTLVIKLNATDLDDGSNGDIVYSFSNYGKDRVRELFNVDPHTGEIRVKGKLDFEEANVYEINVEARDRGPHPLPVHCTVLVDIRDVNDNAPELTLISTSDTVREDALPGTMVALISVSDRDSEENGKTKCEIEKHLPFDIKSSFKNSYRIVTTDPLDRESISEYKITIMCEDSGSPPLSANKTILVHISDINDNAPYFPQNSYTAYIMENNVPGTSIYSVTAMDPDLTDSSHIHYSILETWIKGLPVSSFASIDSGNGIIFSQTSFDYEQLKNFQIQVQAQDDGSPPLCGNVTVNVIILDQNDNPPVVTSPRARNPSEMLVPLSAPPGYLVTKVTATDADSGQNARLSYRLVQATDPSIFTLTHGSGEIRTARRLEDKDALKQTLIILVRDSGHPPLSSTILESIPPGTRFPLQSAHDPDVGINSIRTYRLSSNEHFTLEVQKRSDGTPIAQMILEKYLDREKQRVHHLLLTAVDGGNPERSGSAQVVITVLDVNDNVPAFDNSVYRVSVAENVVENSLVIDLNATDLDEGSNADIIYSFSSHTPDRVRDLFSLEPETGEIRVKGVLDYEKASSYEINVEATNQGANSVPVYCKVLVDILDLNDFKPELTVMSLSSPVPEDAAIGTMIALLSVKDPDSGENGKTSCHLAPNLPFELKSSFENSYMLATKHTLDRETVPHYSINVTCRDGGSPALSTERALLVEISDINDNVPRFEKSSYTAYLMENNAPGSLICTVSARDPDLGQNAHISYSIQERHTQAVPVSSLVSINSDNGNIFSQRSFDYEQLKKIQVYVEAQDAGTPPLSSSTVVNVIVLDQNDNPPTLLSAPAMDASRVTVLRSAQPNSLVTKLAVTDADSGQNAKLFYQLLQAREQSLFRIIHSSGEVRTVRPFDDSDSNEQVLVILVKDNGHPSLSSTFTITLLLTDGVAEILSDFSNLPPDSEPSSNLALYIIICLGSFSFTLLVIIIGLVTTICHNDNVRGTGSLSQTYCYKVPSASEPASNDLVILTPFGSATRGDRSKHTEMHFSEWILPMFDRSSQEGDNLSSSSVRDLIMFVVTELGIV